MIYFSCKCHLGSFPFISNHSIYLDKRAYCSDEEAMSEGAQNLAQGSNTGYKQKIPKKILESQWESGSFVRRTQPLVDPMLLENNMGVCEYSSISGGKGKYVEKE